MHMPESTDNGEPKPMIRAFLRGGSNCGPQIGATATRNECSGFIRGKEVHKPSTSRGYC